MKIAIDIDGTITEYPQLFRELVGSLLTAGHEVHILTAGAIPRQTRLNQLHKLEIVNYTQLFIVDGSAPEGKRDYCKQAGIDLMIENEPSYIAEIRKACPCLLLITKI